MLDSTCIYNVSDDDCYACAKHGLRYKCGECEDYMDNKTWSDLHESDAKESKETIC